MARINSKRRLLSVGHSYAIALNRRLAHEMARVGAGDWEVTAIAPAFFCGDLRPIAGEPHRGELCRFETVNAYFTWEPHLWFYGLRLREIVRRPWDVVHCWQEPYVVAGGQIGWWTPRPTTFVFFTAQNIAKRYPPPFSWFERYCLDRASGWIAPGESVVTAQLSRGYGTRPYRVIPHGVDLEHFRPDGPARAHTLSLLGWGQSDEEPVVGYLGRFVEAKGLRLLTRALDAIRGKWRALFVGSGPLEGYLRGWAERHAERVRVVTGIVHDQVPVYLNAMDVLCAPSQTTRSWREQFGRMIVEAFACGLPVLASDSGEIPNVVGDAGWVVNESDETAWRSALAELLGDRGRRREFAERGLDRARTVYAWPVVARQHLEFFAELLEAAPHGAER